MTSSPDYDIRLIVRALTRYWWVVAAVPAVALAFQAFSIARAPYRAEFRAVVVMPGDTEDPGRSERPELMILDDVPQLVQSSLFAERVAALLPTGADIHTDRIHRALSSSRYARTVTVVAHDNNRSEAVEIATAAQAALPSAIDQALIAAGGPRATVTVIDPVDAVRRGDPDQWTIAGIVTVGMLFVGVLCAVALDGMRRPVPDVG